MGKVIMLHSFLLTANTSSFLEIVLSFIGIGLICYFLFGYPMAWVYAFISKITKSNINYRGSNLTNPDDFDLMVKHTKNQLTEIKKGIANNKDKILGIKNNSSLNKIEKIEKIGHLFDKGYISKEEFEKLKKDLL